MSTVKQKRRVERERKVVAEQTSVIDMHDLLHSIFWNKPTREQMRPIWARVNEQAQARKINQMQAEIKELLYENE